VPSTLLAEVDLQAVGEEGEKILGLVIDKSPYL
jgi:hypothetical protein